MMRKIYMVFALLSCMMMSVQAKTDGQIHPGAIWQDNRGIHINAHGGGVMQYNGTYYWFGEHKAENTSSALVGVTCYTSKDLVHWNYQGVALSVSDQPGSDIEKGCILERPKVVYNEATGKFVMWFHLELKGRGYAAARYGVAVSDNPAGPYRFLRSERSCAGLYPQNLAHRMSVSDYRKGLKMGWWTPAWQNLVKHGLYIERDFDNGQMSRDQTIFVDDDGKAYHVFSSEENLTLHIAELNKDYTAETGRYWTMAEGGQNEAPAVFKHGDTYWMITSGCTGWAPNKARMFWAKSITGPWHQVDNPCRGPKSDITFGGQSTFVLPVLTQKGTEYIFMADIWRPQHPNDARYIWLPIDFDTAGTPVIHWQDAWTPSKPVLKRAVKNDALTVRKQEVLSYIQLVNDYWQANNKPEVRSFWDHAAYHTGNIAAYQLTGNRSWLNYSSTWGEYNKWMGARESNPAKWKYLKYGEGQDYVLFGDWQICFQTYLDLVAIEQGGYSRKMMEDPRVARAIEVMGYEADSKVHDYWWWADALYMVMPVMTKMYKMTGDEKYLDKLYENICYSDSIMLDEETGLYFRDGRYVYPKHKTNSGKKDFWARGDGWVLAGLAKVLQDMPSDYRHYRFFLEKYKKLAKSVAALQQKEGYWTRSMMDAEQAPGPETSGTAFFTYGLLWGINHQILSAKEYMPVINRSWHYLTKTAIQGNGKLGYVQPIGDRAIPGQVINADSQANFGVGAFLLAATEYYYYLNK
ncbi:Rhamnogalacturonyl hydrolase YesR [Segatella bryantii]|uniref:glycoside hydrolase family 88 protein n=1 Tax=Segatella bryantii TaxID=77095 RepID=UPI000895D435|nr:Rhamnogalacturonyl hydrolase YesR [Segatella bryantii]